MFVDSEVATQRVMADLEKGPWLINAVEHTTGSRTEAIQVLTELTAPNLVAPDETEKLGRVAQGLSDWHSYLADRCSDMFRNLTSEQGLSREEANANPDLQTLQSIRRGVRAARTTYNRYAFKSSKHY